MTAPIPPALKPAAVLLLALAALALAACETVPYPTAPPAGNGPGQPMTHSRAAAECWMATEKGHADMDLDRRADVVNKCIEKKMKTAKPAT
jgi:hypothetical protein